ncbi:host attachment protein [Cupriavidus consociatus]|uniref:host attachment protein n=1 Tax=Cupriavidus consociatus TaxID=2821357 RepID=UPI001AE5DBC1|nr:MULTISPECIES: host attachment protein [unclassified Cupriavidus]MBP0620869.1 host attachment protein [Cupriavidus sp. LEh25]MDK2657531.1 host attachment protein [Cupriavidus sp. LEh21]
MTTIWTLAADSTHARIFQAHGMERDMEEIQDFVNPLGRAKDGELRDDAQGRFAGKGEPMHSMAARVDQADKERDEFARMLTRYLEQARTEQRYDKLRLAASPKFLGMLREHLGKEVQKVVFEEIDEDMSRLGAREVQNRLASR